MILKERAIAADCKCPKCGTNDIRRTNRNSGPKDRFLSWLNIYPYRCRECPSKTRFYRFGRRCD
jgi:hypothetical protein